MKNIVLAISLLFAVTAKAGGWTPAAKVTGIDIDRGSGIMVYGEFGNPGSCTATNQFYVNADHPQYDRIYAMVLAGYSAGKKIIAYTHECQSKAWYSVPTTTYNSVTSAGAVYIRD